MKIIPFSFFIASSRLRIWYSTDNLFLAMFMKVDNNKKTLKYLQLQENITKPHNIWHSVKNSEIDVKAGEIKAKIATQTYMVQCQKSVQCIDVHTMTMPYSDICLTLLLCRSEQKFLVRTSSSV
jgi:mRNA deadenylase 3'-5' endonuclease subunit Ccr4